MDAEVLKHLEHLTSGKVLFHACKLFEHEPKAVSIRVFSY